ncbi:MAG TPA: hypothetical protein V6C97_35865 [Oculatellaceae cyanobacterium]
MHKLIRILVVLCCMTGLTGCSDEKLEGEGKDFVSNILEGQKKHWDAAKLDNVLDPASGVETEDVEKLFSMYNEIVGPLENVSDISRTTYKICVGNGPDYQANYTAKLKCAKGSADALVVASHSPDGWKISALNVTSPAFKDFKSSERADATKFADEFTKKMCSVWNHDTLVENADPALAEQLHKHPMATKGVLATGAVTLGPIKDFAPSKFVNIEPKDGTNIFYFATDELFTKGKANIKLSVVRRGSDWKVLNFHFDVHA